MDLLKGFGENRCLKDEKFDEETVELSLGLSCNGRFGVDDNNNNNNIHNNNNNGLIRCSSICGSPNMSSEVDDTTSLTLNVPLTRSCSLPVETKVEWKKRKELEAVRRSEGKRKRVEKVKNGRVVKGLLSEIQYCNFSSAVEAETLRSRLPPLPRPEKMSSGSPASGGSSGVSDLESQPFSGTNTETELKSTASHQPVSHQILSSSPYRSNSIPSHTTSSQTINGNMSKNETLKMMFADMPCVSTKGEGVDGKKIKGFLYRYRKGEVRIVCVCHGSFLTPAEFVKHGGGGDVEHPLRHIVVFPPPL